MIRDLAGAVVRNVAHPQSGLRCRKEIDVLVAHAIADNACPCRDRAGGTLAEGRELHGDDRGTVNGVGHLRLLPALVRGECGARGTCRFPLVRKIGEGVIGYHHPGRQSACSR